MARLEIPLKRNCRRNVSPALRVAAIVLRTIFIVLLMVVALRVSLPQSETIWSAYETPADLIRMLLGLGVCAWLVMLLFQGPHDAQGYRTWLYLGLAAVPFRADPAVRHLVSGQSRPDDHGSISRPVAALIAASVRVAAPSFARALSV